MEYKSKQENILLQLQSPLRNMIEAFDGPSKITSDTHRYNGSVLGGVLSIGFTLLTDPAPIDALTGLWKLFGDYGQEIFGTDSILTLLATLNTNVMLRNVVGLIEPLSADALSSLPILFGIFKTMSWQMNASALYNEWASDNGMTDQLQNVDKIILDKFLRCIISCPI